MSTEPGLRERKKLKTRRLIAETARHLFVDRGFDAVPVAEIARAADVSEATVFNYFPSKEDLVFYGMEEFEAELLAAVRDRPAGEPVATAFGRFILQPRGMLTAQDETVAHYLRGVSVMIAVSPALLEREQAIFGRYTNSLADVIAADTGAGPDDLRPWVVAHALIGVHQALINFVRTRLISGSTDPAQLIRDVRTQGRKAMEILQRGLAGYAPGPAPAPKPAAARARAGRPGG